VAGGVSLARDRAQKFEMPEYVDLGDLAGQIAQRLPQNALVKTITDKILEALNPTPGKGLVIQNATSGSTVQRATGLSIYFPHPEDYAPDYSDLAFSKDGSWKKFLEELFKV
jgi:hypothetical protein